MKIGFDAKRAFNNHRGLGNYSRELIRVLCTLSPRNEYYLFTPAIDETIQFNCPPNASIRLPKTGTARINRVAWRTFDIAKEIDELQLDIYHGLSHELPYGIEKTKVGKVLTMHDMTFLKHPEWFPFFDRMMYKKKYLDSIKKADRIIAVSEQTRRDLLELTDTDPGKVEVVYQGCNPAFREPVSSALTKNLQAKYHLPDTFLLNVAAMEPRKNQLSILKAVREGHIDCPVVIAGKKTEYMKELEFFVARKGMEDRVLFLPDFPLADLPTLYHCATLFVFPSFYEGFGIPVIEALESEVPVIAATGSCLEESGGPDSLYVNPNDPSELAECIKRLLNDSEARHTMAVKGKAYVQQFSDESINENITRIYKSLLP